MAPDLEQVYDELFSYCEKENFAGFDPFDGLNSRIFQVTPLKNFRPARLAWLQMVKLSPVDLRAILKVEKGANPKALALFALAELSRFRATKLEHHVQNAKDLLSRLLERGVRGRISGGAATLAFGYNFDWQSRHFFAPAGTPAIVPTAFASQALVEAYGSFRSEEFLSAAKETCEFIVNDLNRSAETPDEMCFSYTPLDRTKVYNASLLAGECLARVGAITNDERYLELAARSARFVLRRQKSDGSWAYGDDATQTWVDNFHTAYVLLSLNRISTLIPEMRPEADGVIKQGIVYWLDNFFLDDGTPKYYNNSTYPVDIHSVAVAISAACELSEVNDRLLPLAKKTAAWAIENTRDEEGYFYYQVRKNRTVKTPFMRWGQAWMAHALARLIEVDEK